jgi:hypothetical protein
MSETLLVNGTELSEHLTTLCQEHLDGRGLAVTPSGFAWERVVDDVVENTQRDIDETYGEGFTFTATNMVLTMVVNESLCGWGNIYDEDAASRLYSHVVTVIGEHVDARLLTWAE